MPMSEQKAPGDLQHAQLAFSHVVMFSGGLGSWAAAKLVAERHGTDNLTLLFADTKIEDEDLYRFLDEAAANVGGNLVRIADGRDPWQVFFDERFLGNSKVDPCSKILKRKLKDRWLEEHFDPANTTVCVGIDWSEIHRFETLRQRGADAGWTYQAPLCDPPYLSKREIAEWLDREGIKRPRLYGLGFTHNNCGGFCVKAGQAHFKRLLETMPERYAYHERKEQEIRALLGDVSILRDRSVKGGGRPLTLAEFRERCQSGQQCDLFDWGGCGCFAELEVVA
jgi:3'-phosphoadenosine 5'-phosphosulfate sulfotransferase (PAPS reductase)/FAD synthetase